MSLGVSLLLCCFIVLLLLLLGVLSLVLRLFCFVCLICCCGLLKDGEKHIIILVLFEYCYRSNFMKSQACNTSSALASPFSAGASSSATSGSSFSTGLAFAGLAAFLALGVAYHVKHNVTCKLCAIEYKTVHSK